MNTSAEAVWSRLKRVDKKHFQQPEHLWFAMFLCVAVCAGLLSKRNSNYQLIWLFLSKNAQQARLVQGDIAKANWKLARKIGKRWGDLCEVEFEDLEQLAYLGMLKAIARFSPERWGVNKFSSFAVPYMSGEILHFIRDHGRGYRVPRAYREKKARVLKMHREFLAEGNQVSREQCKIVGVAHMLEAISE